MSWMNSKFFVFVFLSLFIWKSESVTSGLTEPGGLSITFPAGTSYQGTDIPITIRAISNNGQPNPSVSDTITLQASTLGTYGTSILSEQFEGPLNGWLDTGFGSFVSQSTPGAMGSGGSASISGSTTSVGGAYKNFNPAANTKPIRASFYVMASVMGTAGPYVYLRTGCPPAGTSATGLETIFDGYGIAWRLFDRSGLTPNVPNYTTPALNAWQKVDIRFSWGTTPSASLYVNDIFQYTRTDIFQGTSGTDGFCQVTLFNRDATTRSNVDNLYVYTSETDYTVVPSTLSGPITLTNGVWSGTIRINQTGSFYLLAQSNTNARNGVSIPLNLVSCAGVTVNRTLCATCAPGSALDENWNCVPCPPGRANELPNQLFCLPCQAGYSTKGQSGQSYCTPCLINTSTLGMIGQDNCIPCAPGFYTDTIGSPDCLQIICGNGVLDPTETCDDNNTISGDGCSSICNREPGYICPTPGQPCVPVVTTQAVVTTDSATTGSSVSSKSSSAKKDNSAVVIVAVIVSIGGILIILAIIFMVIYSRKKKESRKQAQSVNEVPLSPIKSSGIHSSIRIENSSNPEHYVAIPSVTDTNTQEKLLNNSQIHKVEFKEVQIKEGDIIGKGAFGLVWRGIWRGRLVAVKEVKSEILDDTKLNEFIEESVLMSKMQPHPNVVLFLGICVNPLCLITEFLEKGDLRNYILHNKLNMGQKMKIMKDIATGMLHLSLEGIVHRDLAARNVLLSQNLDAKVSDFGLSRISTRNDNAVYTSSDVGPLKWMAPESIRKKKYSSKSDVWSFGVTCIEILTDGEDPYPSMDAVQVATAVVSEHVHAEIPPYCPPELSKILEDCFTYDADQRPEFKVVLSRVYSLIEK